MSEHGDWTESVLEEVVLFHGPSDAPGEDLSSVLGSSELKTLLAANLTSDDCNELILCCLTESGFVTMHVRCTSFVSFVVPFLMLFSGMHLPGTGDSENPHRPTPGCPLGTFIGPLNQVVSPAYSDAANYSGPAWGFFRF
jgi:hypothetical protein